MITGIEQGGGGIEGQLWLRKLAPTHRHHGRGRPVETCCLVIRGSPHNPNGLDLYTFRVIEYFLDQNSEREWVKVAGTHINKGIPPESW